MCNIKFLIPLFSRYFPTQIERVFWSVKLCAALGVALWLSHGLFSSFFNHDVDTKVNIMSKRHIQCPLILIGDAGVLDDAMMSSSRNNCSSNMSVSYDRQVCNKFGRDCPKIRERVKVNLFFYCYCLAQCAAKWVRRQRGN